MKISTLLLGEESAAYCRAESARKPNQCSELGACGMQLAQRFSMIHDNRLRLVRAATLALSEPLSPEDYVVQSMPDASPAKWHLAHTTWFFEEFVLQHAVPGYKFHDEQFRYLFNSYYNTVGPMHSRPHRGLLSLPTVEQVLAYRARIDERMH